MKNKRTSDEAAGPRSSLHTRTPPHSTTPSGLRRQAEKKLAARPADAVPIQPGAAEQALHELRVHQIELELQNEQLRRAQQVFEAAREEPHMVAFLRDITARKQAEEELRVSREQFRALAAHLQNVREEERAALARELHDDLGQHLTALQIDLTWMDRLLQAASPPDLAVLHDKIAAMVPLVERLTELTQNVCAALRPGVLDDLGLVAAIEWQAEDMAKRTGLICVSALPAYDIELDRNIALAMFRILQEALTNVVRHAHATRVEIRLRTVGNELELEIQDNGQGLTPDSISGPKALGVFGMRERTDAFGGSVDFLSEPGKGTTVRVRVPAV